MSPEAYELFHGRYLSEALASSGADGLTAGVGPVPTGNVWTITAAELYPSVNETRIYHFSVKSRTANIFAISVPLSIALTSSRGLPLLSQGMELKLFPGESLMATRDAATAGSSMFIRARYIETVLPYFTHEEPLKKVIVRPQQHGQMFAGPGTGGGGGGGVSGGGGGRGGRGEPEPI